jgi:hypothetical protein
MEDGSVRWEVTEIQAGNYRGGRGARGDNAGDWEREG